MINLKTKQLLPILTFLCLGVYISLTFFSSRIGDNDLWWSLKTGEYIFTTRSIPDKDPFSYTTGSRDAIAHKFVITPPPGLLSNFDDWQRLNSRQSWLGWVTIYLSYRMGGWTGLALLKTVIMTLSFLLLYLAMIREGAYPLISVALIVAVISLLTTGHFDTVRAQMFSCLFLSSQLYMLVDYKKNGKLIYLLPLIMAVWANFHGGFILGIAIQIIFVSSESIQFWLHRKYGLAWGKTFNVKQWRTILVISILTVLAGMLNPNGFETVFLALAVKKSFFGQLIAEYKPPPLHSYFVFWLMLGMYPLFLLCRLKKIDYSYLLIAGFLIIAALNGSRMVLFAVLGGSLYLSVLISDTSRWLINTQLIQKIAPLPFLRQVSNKLSLGQLITSLSLIILTATHISSHELGKYDLKSEYYPAKGVEFIKNNALPKNLFSIYDWGGYLMWNIPNKKVFIDGRCLDEHAFYYYYLVIQGEDRAKSHGQEIWKAILDAYGVQTILMPFVTNTGNVFPIIINKLLSDPEWQLIYQDGTAGIFIKNTPENEKRFNEQYLPKKQSVFRELIMEAEKGITRSPASEGYYHVLGWVYQQQGEMEQAKNVYKNYLSLNPFDKVLRGKLDHLLMLTGEKPTTQQSLPSNPHHW